MRSWRIVGYNGDRATGFERRVPLASCSEAEMRALLQRLVSCRLSENEIIAASLRKTAKDFAGHLEIGRISPGEPDLHTLGAGHYYTATIVDESSPSFSALSGSGRTERLGLAARKRDSFCPVNSRTTPSSGTMPEYSLA